MAVENGGQLKFIGREITIPMPWGYLAGKEWGNPNGSIKIIGLHGLRDNCGTFDRLAPLLPAHYHFVVYDFPGHGLSSPVPDGLYENSETYKAHIRRVILHLGWKRYVMIGHSLGGAAAISYAATYPEEVTHLIGLDPGKPISGDAGKAVQLYRQKVDYMMDIERFPVPPKVRTYEEAMKLIIDKSNGSLDEDSARILMKRGVRVVDQKKNLVIIPIDRKLVLLPYPYYTVEQSMEFAKGLATSDCRILVVTVSSGLVPKWALDMDAYPLRSYLDKIRNISKFYHEIDLQDVTHHFHLSKPEIIVHNIVKFIETSTLGGKDQNLGSKL